MIEELIKEIKQLQEEAWNAQHLYIPDIQMMQETIKQLRKENAILNEKLKGGQNGN